MVILVQDELWKKVTVVGAAGKMGRGIALLLLQEMAQRKARNPDERFLLHLIDTNEESLYSLRLYFKSQVTLFAERNINTLRSYFVGDVKLVSNEEIIHAFVELALDIIYVDTELHAAKDSLMVFEAIVEDVESKCMLLTAINHVCDQKPWIFSNTSSIPIHVLNEKAKLANRIIGFHFYNPPAVQKVVEIVAYEGIDTRLKELALGIGKCLHKTIVEANDIAGFIGNGYMIREIAFACTLVQELTEKWGLTESIYLINRVTQEFLVRPMGIFQLIDYVGIDVCDKIAQIMSHYLTQEHFQQDLIANILAKQRGGQNLDGSQRDGFFKYHRLEPIAIYSFELQNYQPLESWKIPLDEALGLLPKSHFPWAKLHKDDESESKIRAYLKDLLSEDTLGAKLARVFLQKEKGIAENLIKQGVTNSLEDVITVLTQGFYHFEGLTL